MKNLFQSKLIYFLSILSILLCLISSTELKSQTTSDTDEGSAEPATTPKTTKTFLDIIMYLAFTRFNRQ